jgi:hypothetical protein
VRLPSAQCDFGDVLMREVRRNWKSRALPNEVAGQQKFHFCNGVLWTVVGKARVACYPFDQQRLVVQFKLGDVNGLARPAASNEDAIIPRDETPPIVSPDRQALQRLKPLAR